MGRLGFQLPQLLELPQQRRARVAEHGKRWGARHMRAACGDHKTQPEALHHSISPKAPAPTPAPTEPPALAFLWHLPRCNPGCSCQVTSEPTPLICTAAFVKYSHFPLLLTLWGKPVSTGIKNLHFVYHHWKNHFLHVEDAAYKTQVTSSAPQGCHPQRIHSNPGGCFSMAGSDTGGKAN